MLNLVYLIGFMVFSINDIFNIQTRMSYYNCSTCFKKRSNLLRVRIFLLNQYFKKFVTINVE